jgi:hypothetical protein
MDEVKLYTAAEAEELAALASPLPDGRVPAHTIGRDFHDKLFAVLRPTEDALLRAAPGLAWSVVHYANEVDRLRAQVFQLVDAREAVAMMIPAGESSVGSVEQNIAAHLGHLRSRVSDGASEAARLRAQVAALRADRASDIAVTRRDLHVALELSDTALTADDEIRAAWAAVMQRAEDYPILRRSLDMSSEMISDASAALDAAGIPHVDGVSIAERIRALSAELGKPVAREWTKISETLYERRTDARRLLLWDSEDPDSWWLWTDADNSQPMSGGMRDADLHVAEHFRLVGGVHPLTSGVKS